jgi:Lrp/AsnC family transcriptional regulator, leucine-responsive regulatory protein
MNTRLLDSGYDQLDLAILEELQTNGRISVADLARKIHLSQPAVHNRIKRLEREGIIREYVALVDHEAAGYPLMAFIRITVQPHSRDVFCQVQDAINALPAVLECYRTTGHGDLLIKIVASDHKALERFIADHLMVISGLDRVETNVVLNEVKSTTALKLKK